MNNFPKCKWLSCLKIINFPKCKCKWLTFLNPKSNPDLFQHFTIFNPILDQRSQRSTIKHAIHLISSSKLLTTKDDVVSFNSSNFQEKFLRSDFLICPWFFLVIKSFLTWQFQTLLLLLPTSDTRRLSIASNLWICGDKNKIWRWFDEIGLLPLVHFFFCRTMLPRSPFYADSPAAGGDMIRIPSIGKVCST